jgi:protein-disulfide isomerase
VAKRRADEKRAYVTTLFEKYGVRVSLASPPPPPAEEIRGAAQPAIGKSGAPVTIVVFSDYRCPYCQESSRTLNRLLEKHPQDVRVIYRHFPTHPDSKALAQAALCAADQGRFAEYHNLLFGSASAQPNDPGALAKQLGLDLTAFSGCLNSASHAARIDADLKEGQRLGIQGTPTLFVNGVRLRGAQSYERLSAQIQAVLRKDNPVSLTHVH